MKQALTERAIELSGKLQTIAPPPDNEAWGGSVDFLRAVANMIASSENLVDPPEMQKMFSAAWDAYSGLWGDEHDRVMVDCIGSRSEYDRIKDHPEGRKAILAIMERVKDTHGDLAPGEDGKVDVGDILVDMGTD